MTNEKLNAAYNKLISGGLVIIQDDESRENEGDLVCYAKTCSEENINFMLTYAKGLICVPLAFKKVVEINLPMQPVSGSSRFQTAFTVSVDAAKNITTGISAKERALSIRTLASSDVSEKDFITPGHIFPLRAHPNGIEGRLGHTEASIALMQLAGLEPSAVICEILNSDGTMARTKDLENLANHFDLPFLTIAEISSAYKAGRICE